MTSQFLSPPVAFPRISVEAIAAGVKTSADLSAAPIRVALAPVAPNVPYEELTWSDATWVSWTQNDDDSWTGYFRWNYAGDRDAAVYLLLSELTNGADVVVRSHGVVDLT